MTQNELDGAFTATRAQGRGALIPYLTGGYPDPDRFVDLAVAVLDAGADVLEIGVPFSDPLLDGPAIQRSQSEALHHGVTPRDCLRYVREIRARTNKPVLLMGAFNPICAYGVDAFCADARAAGASALITPDLPVEEQEDLRVRAAAHDLHLIQMVAPTSTEERIQRVCAAASGFVYCVSVSGVTGTHAGVADSARPLVARVKAYTDVPTAVGFGIASGETARAVAQFADGVIVGSALINVLADHEGADPIDAAVEFVKGLRDALNRPSE